MEKPDFYNKNEFEMKLYGKNYTVINYTPRLSFAEYSQKKRLTGRRLYDVLDKFDLTDVFK